MIIKAYLVISSSGSLRVVKGRPYLNNNEIAVLLNMDVPKEFFERLIPLVNIQLPKEGVIEPDVETVLSITSREVAEKLKIEAAEVYDGLKDMLTKKDNE